jgi:predicted KAP-like P-loop ATPase
MTNDQAIAEHALSSDLAQIDPAHDSLGHAPFAKSLANSIVHFAPHNGIVIGIYAPWGAGKTTLLNFVKYFLSHAPDDQQPLIVDFNPWWFSGQDDLARLFFSELFSALGKDKRFERLGEKVAAYANLLGAVPIYGGALKAAAELAKPGEKGISQLKNEVTEELSKQKKKILIVIDDIDRLTAEETRQLFRVVKAVANFPNVIYLLAFDRNIAAKALDSIHSGDGNVYLEKIVQVPFELPMPDTLSLETMLSDGLNVILDAGGHNPAESGLFDLGYWLNVYRDGIRHFIKTPRDVVRLINTLSVTYSGVQGEVNAVDFIAVETLRVFVPTVYEIIRSNAEMFTGTTVSEYAKKDFAAFHENWFKDAEPKHKEAIKQLVRRLFPKTLAAWHPNPAIDSGGNWRRQRSIAHPEVFPTYFRLAPPTGSLSNTVVLGLIKNLSDATQFEETLLNLQKNIRPDGISHAREFLSRLDDYIDEISVERIGVILLGLFDAGDRLMAAEPETVKFLDLGMRLQIVRTTHFLLQRIDKAQRFGLLREAIKATSSYGIVAEAVAQIGKDFGKYGSPIREWEQEVTLEQLTELEKLADEKIRSNIKIDDFHNELSLPWILKIWAAIGSPEEVSQWLQRTVAGDEGLLKVLVAFLNRSSSQSSASPVVKHFYRIAPYRLKPFIEPESVKNRVENLATRDDLTEEQRRAVLQFLQELEDQNEGINIENAMYQARQTVFNRYNASSLWSGDD